jgi:hypothetical protein
VTARARGCQVIDLEGPVDGLPFGP